MQEPQYAAHRIRQLTARVAEARSPTLAIMKMAPLLYFKRISRLPAGNLDVCYTDGTVREGFDPALIMLASPDA